MKIYRVVESKRRNTSTEKKNYRIAEIKFHILCSPTIEN